MSIFDIHVRVQIVWRQELKVPKDCKLPTTPMVGICRVTIKVLTLFIISQSKLHCCAYGIRLIRWCSRHIHFPRLLDRISAPPIETHRNRRIPCHKLLTPKPISPVVNLSETPSLACPTALPFLLLWLPGFPELYLPSTRHIGSLRHLHHVQLPYPAAAASATSGNALRPVSVSMWMR
jgi:hypothetical protein